MIGKGTGIMTAVSFKSLCLGGVNDVRALHGADRRQGNHLSGRQEPFSGQWGCRFGPSSARCAPHCPHSRRQPADLE